MTVVDTDHDKEKEAGREDFILGAERHKREANVDLAEDLARMGWEKGGNHVFAPCGVGYVHTFEREQWDERLAADCSKTTSSHRPLCRVLAVPDDFLLGQLARRKHLSPTAKKQYRKSNKRSNQ